MTSGGHLVHPLAEQGHPEPVAQDRVRMVCLHFFSNGEVWLRDSSLLSI